MHEQEVRNNIALEAKEIRLVDVRDSLLEVEGRVFFACMEFVGVPRLLTKIENPQR